MSVRKIYLMSPREPSGATWLINCLLELGIKTYRKPCSNMWARNASEYALKTQEEILKKWLPALWDHQQFYFRDDIEVEWAHDWPKVEHDDYQVIYFARDPRDSLFSRYKREAPDQTFEEFLMFPDVDTLLDKVHHWRLFNLAWMEHPRHQVFRFEDYKQDAEKVLADVLQFIGLAYSHAEMQCALVASTFERASQAELKYRAKYPEDKELINRSGKVGEWRIGGVDPKIVAYIDSVCGDALCLQGYVYNENMGQEFNYSNLASNLPFLQQVKMPGFAYQYNNGLDLSDSVLVFSESLHYEMLKNAKLRQYEIAPLLDNLTILLRIKKSRTRANLRSLYRAFDVYGLELGWWEKLRYRVKVRSRRIRGLFGRLVVWGKRFNE